jgi:cardiolipin synthase
MVGTRQWGLVRKTTRVATLLCLLCTVLLPARIGHAGTRSINAIASGVVPTALYVEPQDGEHFLTRALDHAQHSVFVEIYILTDRSTVRALERAASQDVGVYVLLEPHPFGMGPQPQRMAAELVAAGVHVRWAPRNFALTHSKLIVIDDKTAIVSTANLSRSGFHSNRELVVIERERVIVHDLSSLFRADWDGMTPPAHDANLVVAPSDARTKLSALISGARHSVRVYAEEMADPGIEKILREDAMRRVTVRVILPSGAVAHLGRWVSTSHVSIREMAVPYAHAKMVVVDSREGFIGSENISTQSLDRNREVGLLVRGPAVLTMAATFDADWKRLVPARTAP